MGRYFFHRNVVWQGVASLLLAHCQGDLPGENLNTSQQSLVKDIGGKTTSVNGTTNITTNGKSEDITFTIGSDNTPRDFLFINDVNVQLLGDEFRDRLQPALVAMVTRFSFVAQDFRIGVAPGKISTQTKQTPPKNQPETAGLYNLSPDDSNPPASTATLLKQDTPSFRETLLKRLLNNGIDSYYNSYRPFTALKKVLDNTVNQDLLRSDTILSVVFVSQNNEKDEIMDADDLVTYLNTKKGSGKWELSLITPPIDGCIYDTKNNSKSNVDESGNKGLMLKLQSKVAGSKLLDACAKPEEYNDFFLNLSINTQQNTIKNYTVPLKNKAMWSSIVVKNEQGITLNQWTYKPGDLQLQLSYKLPEKTKVFIHYDIDDGTKPNIVTDTTNTSIVEKIVTPQEKDYNDNINPLLTKQCGSCHGQGGNRTVLVDNFDGISTAKITIKQRINLPTTDNAYMPKGGKLSAQELDTLNKWIDSL